MKYVIQRIDQKGIKFYIVENGIWSLPDFVFKKDDITTVKLSLFTNSMKVYVDMQRKCIPIPDPLNSIPQSLDKLINIIVRLLIKHRKYNFYYDLYKSSDPNVITKFINYFFPEITKRLHETYEYQRHIIKKGEFLKLKDIKFNDRILQEYPEMRDFKKQIDWG